MRHKWNRKIKSKCVDGGTVFCVRCGCVKQFVKGVPTYYIPEIDIVHDRIAPKCKTLNPQ